MSLFGDDFGFTLRSPCRWCGSTTGRISTKNGQDCVYCRCGRHLYNAPKTETGRAVRSVTTIHNGIKPKQRARILERATGRCEFCGNRDKPIHVGHIMSVDDCLKHGATDQEANSDDNLASMCDECNLGIGKLSIAPRMYIAILKARHGLNKLTGDDNR